MYEKGLKRETKMNKYSKEHPGMGNFIITMLPRALGLGFKLGLFYLGFKRKAKKAGKLFEKELIAAGMDKEMARQLKEDYMQTSHVFRQLRFSGFTK